jgi:hypothetical protein
MPVEPFGPLVDDSEDAYRAILYPLQWAEAQNRPSSAAFDDEVFSVDLKSKTTQGTAQIPAKIYAKPPQNAHDRRSICLFYRVLLSLGAD